MNASYIALLSVACLFLAYRFYARFLSKKVFFGNHENPLPSIELKDGVDFVPTKKHVLFGHHFSSIAGAAPILGPAIAVIWGWLPALIWIVFGSIFIGAVHDYGSLVLSALFKGRSIGTITGEILGKRAKFLFLFIIFILVFIVIAVFAYVIASLFVLYPGSVIPINFEILVAISIGVRLRKSAGNLLIPSLIALVMLYFMIYIGNLYPIEIPIEYCLAGSPVFTWVVLLLIYGFFAAVLPVDILLQPRDFINSHQLILGLIIIFTGLFISAPIMDAPAINKVEFDLGWFPFLFITIACGAISGFHSLVSSGTTSKQLENIQDAKFIGYGGMLGEACLAIAATIAVSAGFNSEMEWLNHYESFSGAAGLASKLSAFVNGTASFVDPLIAGTSLGVNGLSTIFISVLVISFAATSLDTAVRIQRYVLGEIGVSINKDFTSNRYLTSGLAVILSFLLVLADSSGTGGLVLWPLFGSTNQLLGALTLMIITIWLFLQKRNFWVTFIPLIVLLVIVSVASIYNIVYYFQEDNYLLTIMASAILICHIWLLIEGLRFLFK